MPEFRRSGGALALALALAPAASFAQIAPSEAEVARYTGLHGAAAADNATEIERLLAAGADREARDGNGRTPLHVAVYRRKYDAARLLLAKGADANALDRQRYDVVTIAAVADDVAMLRLVLEGGASARNVTSPYDGTALIAAAHLGRVEVVRLLIEAGAPLDHVNNLGWTALMESIVLGDGGRRHTETLRLLVAAGANASIPDRSGITPLAHARGRGYKEMVEILVRGGARTSGAAAPARAPGSTTRREAS